MFRSYDVSTVLYSVGKDPLANWDLSDASGRICKTSDAEIRSHVIEICGTNPATCRMTCPRAPRRSLAVRLPFFAMIVKNLKRYFAFELTVLDNARMHRRIRVANFQSKTTVDVHSVTVPIRLSDGWNRIQLNLAEYVRRVYGTQFVEACSVTVHASARLRRIYFARRLYDERDLPREFKLFQPVESVERYGVEIGRKGNPARPRPSPPPNSPKPI